MNRKKQATPAQIMMLGIGAIGGLALAFWSVNNAMSPPAAKPGIPVMPATPPGQAATAAPTQNTGTGAAAPSQASPSQLGSSSEAELAMDVDPFDPMSMTAGRTAANNTGAQANVSPPQAPRTKEPALDTRFPQIPPFPVAPPRPIETEPQLVGTLLGDQPSAVFKSDKSLAIVPVGKRFGPWKVVSVGHGSAVVKTATRTVHIETGTKSAGGGVQPFDEHNSEPVTPGRNRQVTAKNLNPSSSNASSEPVTPGRNHQITTKTLNASKPNASFDEVAQSDSKKHIAATTNPVSVAPPTPVDTASAAQPRSSADSKAASNVSASISTQESVQDSTSLGPDPDRTEVAVRDQEMLPPLRGDDSLPNRDEEPVKSQPLQLAQPFPQTAPQIVSVQKQKATRRYSKRPRAGGHRRWARKPGAKKSQLASSAGIRHRLNRRPTTLRFAGWHL